MNASSVKEEARLLVDSLPDNATWDDLWHGLHGRLAAPAHAPSLSEAQLLSRINDGFPEGFWRRYHALIRAREQQTLSPPQQQELVNMADTLEARSAERLTLLTQLAGLRGVSVSSLIEELGLRPKAAE